jgi:hypothetical protein
MKIIWSARPCDALLRAGGVRREVPPRLTEVPVWSACLECAHLIAARVSLAVFRVFPAYVLEPFQVWAAPWIR